MVEKLPVQEHVLYKISPTLTQISSCVANDLNKIDELLKLFKEKGVYELHIDIISEQLDITSRQVYFYVEAGKTLAGLYEIKKSIVYLKTNGYFFLNHKTNKKLKKFIMRNISRNEEIQFLMKNNYSKDNLLNYLNENTNLNKKYSQNSLIRRCGSLTSWFKQLELYIDSN